MHQPVGMKVELSVDLGGVSPRNRFAAIASLVIAALVAFASIGGIASPVVYARETTAWRIQGIAQDWANLLFAVPVLVASAILVLRGSRRARLVLGGGLVYTAYAFAIYAFAVHFNPLFLVYCGALGGSLYALAALVLELDDVRSWFDERVPYRLAGGFEMACAALFALLWLAQIVPAVVRDIPPVELAEAGLLTNPVHVLDLTIVLPAMFVGGWFLWHRRAGGYAAVPIFLGFGALMAAAIALMGVLAGSVVLAIATGTLAVASAALLVWMLHDSIDAAAIARLRMT